LSEKYSKKFNNAIINNVVYWTKYTYTLSSIEGPNIFKAIEVALKYAKNSEIIENLLKVHFYWMTTLQKLSSGN
jgi:hypothetical protein